MKVLFISKEPTWEDRSAWSGTIYQAFRGLQRAGFDVDYLCAMRDYRQNFWDKLWCTYWLRIPHKFGKSTRMDESLYMRSIYRKTLKDFDYSQYDIIFVPTHLSIVAALPKNIKAKIVHLVDATVDSLFGYYNEFSNLWFHNYWEAHYLGKKAFRRADLIIASSDWCKNNAIKQYGIPAERIKVVEFGANLDMKDIPATPKHYDPSKPLNIYWSGVNWERKGGDVAFEACHELIKRGHDIQFHITGMRQLPAEISPKPWVINHGFLNKNNPEEYRKLIRVMSEMDIFLFPSRAECSSIALCEANGFGLPCFVYDTGGTANYVKDGYNGRMLPLSATGKHFADAIEESKLLNQLEGMSSSAINQFKDQLNWESWSKRVSYLINGFSHD